MSRVDIDRQDVVRARMDRSDIEALQDALMLDTDSNVDINNLPAGVEIVGAGLCDGDGNAYIEGDIDKLMAGFGEGSCLLCRHNDKYCNLWIGAGDGNGFDDQVELHFEC